MRVSCLTLLWLILGVALAFFVLIDFVFGVLTTFCDSGGNSIVCAGWPLLLAASPKCHCPLANYFAPTIQPYLTQNKISPRYYAYALLTET